MPTPSKIKRSHLSRESVDPPKRPSQAGDTDGGPAAYEPTPEERAAVARYLERKKRTAPRLSISQVGDARNVSLDHPKPSLGYVLLKEALGTSDNSFLDGFLKQFVNAGSQGEGVDEGGVNFMLSVVVGLEPKDQTEAMLAGQMAAVHMATMTMTRRLAHAETIQQQDSAERALNKLARTFATQVEALKRYRTGGQQKVTVEHVTVNEGGQAIVGNVATNAPPKPPESAPAALPDQSATVIDMNRSRDRPKERVPRKR